MQTRTLLLISEALALLAATGCEPSDYGDCDKKEVKALPVVRGLVQPIPTRQTTLELSDIDLPPLEAGEDTLLCLEHEDGPLECPDMPEEDDEWHWAWITAIGEIEDALPTSTNGNSWMGSRDCGPMSLNGDCCWTVTFVEDDSRGSDDGRPFLVGGLRRTAPLVSDSGWCPDIQPSELPPAARTTLTARWGAAGRAEHASVGAFSRFALVLLHHGAPAELVGAAHAAALDEVRHAELCFGLASAYAGEVVGPGPLDVRGSLQGELDLEQVVRTLVEEGCVGETLAALEAGEAARLCQDVVVREILEGIAGDEARHAALAWKTLRWLVGRHPELGDVARQALAASPASSAGAQPRGADHLEHLGVLSPDSRSRVDTIGRREVVATLASDVLGASTPSSQLEA